MKEYWTDQLRQRLEGHKAEPPSGLWEGISRQMGFDDKPVCKDTTYKRWYLAAAAAVLVLIGFFVYQDVNDKKMEQPLQAETAKQQVSPQEPATPVASEQKSSNELLFPTHEMRPHEHALLAQRENPIQIAETKTTEAPHIEQVEDTTASEVPPHTVPEGDVTTESADDQKSAATVAINDDWDIEQHRSPDRQKWSVCLNASGGLLAVQNTERMEKVNIANYMIINGITYAEYNGNSGPQYANATFEVKHHLPIRLGVGVQYELSNRLALLSGLSYTYLFSEFNFPVYHTISYTQKMHYLGIPVGLTWKLWSSSHFSLYAAGQALLEKCLNEKPWQWSVSASAGAEYRISRELGLYLQPSFGYYFNDGSSFEHYYKEHPLAPSIEFGLRLHLNH